MKKVVFMFLIIFSFVACSKTSAVDEKRDVIVKVDGVKNIDTFKKFITNVKKGKEDRVRIVHYTMEGDPIFETVEYDGKTLRYIRDNSQDKFGDNKIESDTCQDISEEIREDRTAYKLVNCEKGNEYELITVPEL